MNLCVHGYVHGLGELTSFQGQDFCEQIAHSNGASK